MARTTRQMQLEAIAYQIDRRWDGEHYEGHDYNEWLEKQLTSSFDIIVGGTNDTSFRWEGVTLAPSEYAEVRAILDSYHA